MGSRLLLLVGLALSVSCAPQAGAGWSEHKDALGFSVQVPGGWQVAGDRQSGRVTVSGPNDQQVLVWPVFIQGQVGVEDTPAILQRLVAAAGLNAAWTTEPQFLPGAVRRVGTSGERTLSAAFAWIQSPRGTAGFLYSASARTATYGSEVETLSRILESFRATGAPAGHDASSSPGLQWVRWQDPKEDSFSLEVPRGWEVQGGAFRFAPVDVRKAVLVSSPDGAVRITGGDQELPTFTEPTQMLAMTGFREGSWYSPGYGVNMMVRRYSPGAEFAAEYVRAKLARGCERLELASTRERPDADGPLNQLMSGLASAGGMMRIESGEASFTCEANGRPAGGYCFASTLRTAAAGMPGGIWQVSYLYGYLAPKEMSDRAREVLTHMLASYRDNPQWVAMQQNVTAATSRIVAQTQQEVSRIISDTFSYKGRVDDEISRRRENAILGTVDVVDGASGRQFKVENSSNYYWLDNTGVIVGTETSTNPGWNFRQLTSLP